MHSPSGCGWQWPDGPVCTSLAGTPGLDTSQGRSHNSCGPRFTSPGVLLAIIALLACLVFLLDGTSTVEGNKQGSDCRSLSWRGTDHFKTKSGLHAPQICTLVETWRGPDDNQKAVLDFHTAILKQLTSNWFWPCAWCIFTEWLYINPLGLLVFGPTDGRAVAHGTGRSCLFGPSFNLLVFQEYVDESLDLRGFDWWARLRSWDH